VLLTIDCLQPGVIWLAPLPLNERTCRKLELRDSETRRGGRQRWWIWLAKPGPGHASLAVPHAFTALAAAAPPAAVQCDYDKGLLPMKHVEIAR
jgi:hypothetical protein